jgi:hypothetical protein
VDSSSDQHLTGSIEEYAESLASVSFGDRYTCGVSGFSGVATSRLISMSEPELIHIENESGDRWIPANRLQDETGSPVLTSAIEEVASS